MNVFEFYQATNKISENFITARLDASVYLLNNYDAGRPLQNAAREQTIRWLKQSRALIQTVQGHQLLADAEGKEPDIIQRGLKSYENAFYEYCMAEDRKIDMEKFIIKQGQSFKSSIDDGKFWIDGMQNKREHLEALLGGYISRNLIIGGSRSMIVKRNFRPNAMHGLPKWKTAMILRKRRKRSKLCLTATGGLS